MGREATELEITDTGINAIPMTLGDPDGVDPNLDLIGGDDEDENPAIVALQEAMEDLKASQKDEREFLQNTILEMSQRPPQVVAAPAATATTTSTALDLSDLPDNVENHDEFIREIGERVTKFVGEQNQITTTNVTAQSQTAAGLQDLDNRFSRDYKDLAKKPALFQAVVSQEVKKIQNRGLKPQQFIFADPDKFLALVAKNMKEELGIEDDDDDVVDLKLVSSGKKTSRTKGVKGGSMPSLKKGDKGPGKKPLTLAQEFKKQQHDMGLI